MNKDIVIVVKNGRVTEVLTADDDPVCLEVLDFDTTDEEILKETVKRYNALKERGCKDIL